MSLKIIWKMPTCQSFPPTPIAPSTDPLSSWQVTGFYAAAQLGNNSHPLCLAVNYSLYCFSRSLTHTFLVTVSRN